MSTLSETLLNSRMLRWGIMLATLSVCLPSVRAADIVDTRKTTTPVHFELIPGLVPTVFMKPNCEWTWIKGWYDAKIVSQDTKYYSPNTYCILQLVVTPRRGINITFTEWDFPPVNASTGLCDDYVLMIDVEARKATTGRLCGSDPPPNFVVPHNHVAILFVTDGNDEDKYRGFKVHYRRIPLPSLKPGETPLGINNIYDTYYYTEVVTRPPPSTASSYTSCGMMVLVLLSGLALLLTNGDRTFE